MRALARLHDDYVQVLVRAEVPATRVGELRGRRVSIGEPGSGVAFTARRLLTAAGLRPGEVQESALGLRAAIDALQAGTIDAFFWSGGVPTYPIAEMVARLAARGTPVRMLDLSDVAAALQAAHPRVYQQGTVAAARAYPGLSSPVVPTGAPTMAPMVVPTLVVRNLLLTTDRMDQTPRRCSPVAWSTRCRSCAPVPRRWRCGSWTSARRSRPTRSRCIRARSPTTGRSRTPDHPL